MLNSETLHYSPLLPVPHQRSTWHELQWCINKYYHQCAILYQLCFGHPYEGSPGSVASNKSRVVVCIPTQLELGYCRLPTVPTCKVAFIYAAIPREGAQGWWSLCETI